MISPSIAILPVPVIDEPMNESFHCKTGIGSPGIRTDNRSHHHLSGDEREKGRGVNILDNLRPDLTIAAQNPKDGLFLSSPSSFDPGFTKYFPFVFPLATNVGFIDLNPSREDFRDIFDENSPNSGQCSENSFPFNPGSLSDLLATLFEIKPDDDRFPLIPGQVEKQPVRTKIIATLRTVTLSCAKTI